MSSDQVSVAVEEELDIVEVVPEPEAQFDAVNDETLSAIEDALISQGACHTKTQNDAAIYYDTKNFRLAREGVEARGKHKKTSKGSYWRFDLKTPIDTNMRSAEPDQDGVVSRIEMKIPQPQYTPSLKVFFGQKALTPVAQRVKGFFDKILEPKFVADFEKRKFELEYTDNDKTAVIEYSLQRGHIRSVDGTKSSKPLFIAEVEHKSGDETAYRAAVRAFNDQFSDLGVNVMQERKWHIGLRLCQGIASGKAARKLQKLFTRLERKREPQPLAA